MFKTLLYDEIIDLKLDISKWDLVFLYWDLASWKTTLSKHIINNLFWSKEDVKSPTYNYYNIYNWINWIKIYHFDLYRLKNYDEFFAIWGEDIIDNLGDSIAIIEWPEILNWYYNPNLKIFLEKTLEEKKRNIKIEKL